MAIPRGTTVATVALIVCMALIPSPSPGQVAVWYYNSPGSEPTDVVKLRFRFSVGQNEGSILAHPKIKLILGTFRVWGGAGGETYILEANLYTSRWSYEDPTCPPPGPPIGLQGEETYDEATIRMAIPDYVGEGKTGTQTFSPEMFPRQTYEIDYIQGLFKTDLMSQANLNGQSGLVEIERGPIISDKAGWQCAGSLPADTEFRQWNAFVTIGGVRHGMAFAVPNENGRYLYPWEMPSFTTEFFANIGLFQVFYWDFAFRRENGTTWQTMPKWKVVRDAGLPGRPYGARVVPVGGRHVLELSNVGGSPPYLGVNAVFDLPAEHPTLNIGYVSPNLVFSWGSNYPGYGLYRSDGLFSAEWEPAPGTATLDGNSYFLSVSPSGPVGFFRLELP